MDHKPAFIKLSVPFVALAFAGATLSTHAAPRPAPARGQERFCPSCSIQVAVSGRVTHHKDSASVAIQGAEDAKDYREDVNGPRFTLSIPRLRRAGTPFGSAPSRRWRKGRASGCST